MRGRDPKSSQQITQVPETPSKRRNDICHIRSVYGKLAPSTFPGRPMLSESLAPPDQTQLLSREEHGALHTSDLFLIDGIDIGQNSILSRWYLLGDIDFFLQRQDTLFDRAGHVDLRQVVTQVGFLFDQGDEAVLDLEENRGAGLDVFVESSVCSDGQFLSSVRSQMLVEAQTTR